MGDAYLPTGPDAVAMHKLRKMVSLSSTFQTRSGLSQVDLWDRGFYLSGDGALDQPIFIIDVAESGQRLLAGGSKNHMGAAGTLELIIAFKPTTEQVTDNDQRLEAADIFTSIASEIADLSGADDLSSDDGLSHLDIHDMTATAFGLEPPKPTQPSTGRRFWSMYQLTWGHQAQ